MDFVWCTFTKNIKSHENNLLVGTEQYRLVMVMVVTSRDCNNSHKRRVTIIITEVW